MEIQISQVLPAGVILPFAGDTVPHGFLLCDGQAVSRSTYARLFAAIGIAHGQGNGTTTFHLPDCRGMFLRGVSGTSFMDPDANSRLQKQAGGNMGNNVGSIQGDAFRTHTHAITRYNSTDDGSYIDAGAGNGSSGNTNTQATGGSETRPVNIYVHYIIKT